MLISPPFLPPRDADQTDAQWIATAMSGLAAGSVPHRGERPIVGNFPVSLEMGWHGGIHLQAPNDAQGNAMPVRAIADGTVVFARPPTAQNTQHDHALNYGATPGSSCWTSDGVVLIRHDTEIGAQLRNQGGNRTETAVSVTYYSLYVHLSSIDLTERQRVYRKDQVGRAGYIYGQPNRIHFEIFCDDENLQKLVGRNTGALPIDRDGRTDVVFGELYFYLPEGTAVYAQRPLSNNPLAHVQQQGGGLVPLQAAHTTTAPFIVGLRYAQGDGPVRQRGSARLTSYHPNGEVIGTLADNDENTNAEYDLYTTAKNISESYAAGNRPAPSAVYELLRFGRVINTADETLNPANVPHWRQILHPEGTGWVNLNATNVRKFSDADFPHWKHWCLIDDSADRDSRCDSPTILGWFDTNSDARVDAAEAQAGMRNEAIVKKLEHAICKFPTEWNKDTIDARWGWLRTETQENPEPLSKTDFDLFKAHAEKLCFWGDVRTQTPALPANPWRFHPLRFIENFRVCTWLSSNELVQLVPNHIIRKPGSHRSPSNGHWEAPAINPAVAFIRTNGICLNLALRKFFITSRPRLACFFGNSVQETGWFRSLEESDGGQPNLHLGWYGRGFLQLTNPNGSLGNGNNNYYQYFRFIGHSPALPPGQQELAWRNAIGTVSYHAAQSAGAYWSWPNKSAPSRANPNLPQVSNANIYADAPSNNQRRTINTGSGTKVWYYNQSFTDCAAAVNLPAAVGQNPPNLNGLIDRSTAFINALVVLDDLPTFESETGAQAGIPENFTRRNIP